PDFFWKLDIMQFQTPTNCPECSRPPSPVFRLGPLVVPVVRRIRAETAAIMAQASHDKFPILGYAIINGVVIGISLVAWYVAKTGLFLPPPAEAAGRPGVAAALVFVPVCFLLATAFDLAWRLFSQ